MALPRYITLSEAATRLGTGLAELNQLIKNGTLKAAQVAGEIVVSEPSLQHHKTGKRAQPITMGSPTGTRKEDLPEYKQFEHLADMEIWISEAERKYGVSNPIIIGWVKKGFIRKLGKDKNRVLLDEQDVAYCASVYNLNKGRGKWIFNSDGTPYAPRNIAE